MTGPAKNASDPDSRTPPAIRGTDLVKDFGFRRVLDRVSLDVPRGTFLSLFGPNGAGKTTLIRILAGIARATAGTVEIGGRSLGGPDRSTVRGWIGLIAHQTLLYDGLTGFENLLFYGRLYRVTSPRERAETLLREFGLWERRDDLAGTYSRGLQQRLAIARALVHEPIILLLDEPFTGLDPAAAGLLRSHLARLKDQGRAALIATHDLEEGLALADRWAILSEGRISAAGSCKETSREALVSTYFRSTGLPPSLAGLRA